MLRQQIELMRILIERLDRLEGQRVYAKDSSNRASPKTPTAMANTRNISARARGKRPKPSVQASKAETLQPSSEEESEAPPRNTVRLSSVASPRAPAPRIYSYPEPKTERNNTPYRSMSRGSEYYQPKAIHDHPDKLDTGVKPSFRAWFT